MYLLLKSDVPKVPTDNDIGDRVMPMMPLVARKTFLRILCDYAFSEKNTKWLTVIE